MTAKKLNDKIENAKDLLDTIILDVDSADSLHEVMTSLEPRPSETPSVLYCDMHYIMGKLIKQQLQDLNKLWELLSEVCNP